MSHQVLQTGANVIGMAKTTTTKTKQNDVESGIRDYLLHLSDPTFLIDQTAIDAATKAVEDAIDPIDKLKAISARTAAETADPTPLIEHFVAHARAWAEASGVNLEGFVTLGVPDDVLRRAGFQVAPKRMMRQAGGAKSTTTRAAAVTMETMIAWIEKQAGKPFELNDAMRALGGGSQATWRKAIDEVKAKGLITSAPKADHSGRGRAPMVYTYKPQAA